jgi:hypothetical protein
MNHIAADAERFHRVVYVRAGIRRVQASNGGDVVVSGRVQPPHPF